MVRAATSSSRPDAVMVVDDTALVKRPALGRGEAPICGPLGKRATARPWSRSNARPRCRRRRPRRFSGGWCARRRRAARACRSTPPIAQGRSRLDEIDRVLASCGTLRVRAATRSTAGPRVPRPRRGGYLRGASRRSRRSIRRRDARVRVPGAQADRPPARAPGPRPRGGRCRAVEARGRRRSARNLADRHQGTAQGRVRYIRCAGQTARSGGEGGTDGRERAGIVGEHRAQASKVLPPNLPPDATLETLAALIKARWVCERCTAVKASWDWATARQDGAGCTPRPVVQLAFAF